MSEMDSSTSALRRRRLLRAIFHAYPDRVTLRREKDASRGVMAGGRGILLEPASMVRRAPLFLSIDPRDASPPAPGAQEARVSLASEIEYDWLEEVFPHLLDRRVECRISADRERVMAFEQVLFADLPVRERPCDPRRSPEAAAQALFEHLRERLKNIENQDPKLAGLLGRIRFLNAFMPDLGLGDFGPAALEEALRQACEGCYEVREAIEHRLPRAILNTLTVRQRRALEQEAPEFLEVPSGGRIRLQYDPSGGPPALAVRLQELFGLAETPRLAGGRAGVVLHLLAPNFRPVQVTTDLKSFWKGGYREVRKELRARYPKHPWPEDPWSAAPVSVGGRRRGGGRS